MSFKMPKSKVTVLKRTINQDVIDGFLDDEYEDTGSYDCFRDGQEIVMEDYSLVPEGFCSPAWADIRKDVLTVAMGADVAGIRQSGTIYHHRLHRLVQDSTLQGGEDGT